MVSLAKVAQPAVGVVALALCLGAPPFAGAASATASAQLASGDIVKLCTELGRTIRLKPADKERQRAHHDALIAAAKQRAGFDDRDYSPIQQRMPRIGMRSCSLLASMGPATRSNRTFSASGEDQQLIYTKRDIYVYTHNNVVTGWQEH